MTVTMLTDLFGSMLAPLVGVEPGFPSPDSADTSVIRKDSASSGRLSSKINRFNTLQKESIFTWCYDVNCTGLNAVL